MRKHDTSAFDIGQRLKTIRQRLHVQQKEMAATMKVAPSYLSEIENGKGNPGPEFFVRLASLYKINLNYLFMGIGEMLIDNKGNEKKPGFDVDGFVETIEDVVWLMENSVVMRYIILVCVNKALFDERAMVKENVKKVLAAGKKQRKSEVSHEKNPGQAN